MAKQAVQESTGYMSPALSQAGAPASGDPNLLIQAGQSAGRAAQISGELTAQLIKAGTEVGKAAYEGYVGAETLKEIKSVTDWLYNPNIPKTKNATFVGPKVMEQVGEAAQLREQQSAPTEGGVAVNTMGVYTRRTRDAVNAGIISPQEAMVRLASKQKELIAAHPGQADKIRKIFQEETGIGNFQAALVHTALTATPPEDKMAAKNLEIDKLLATNPEVQRAFYETYKVGGSDIFNMIVSSPTHRAFAQSVANAKTASDVAARVRTNIAASNKDKADATGGAFVLQGQSITAKVYNDLLALGGLPEGNMTQQQFTAFYSKNAAQITLITNQAIQKLTAQRDTLAAMPEANQAHISVINSQITAMEKFRDDKSATTARAQFEAFSSATKTYRENSIAAYEIMNRQLTVFGATGENLVSFANIQSKLRSDDPAVRKAAERQNDAYKKTMPALHRALSVVYSDFIANGGAGPIQDDFRNTQGQIRGGNVTVVPNNEGGSAAIGVAKDNAISFLKAYDSGTTVDFVPTEEKKNEIRATFKNYSEALPETQDLTKLVVGKNSAFDKMLLSLPESERTDYLKSIIDTVGQRLNYTSGPLMQSIITKVQNLQTAAGNRASIMIGIDPATNKLTVGNNTTQGFVPHYKDPSFRNIGIDINASGIQRNLDNLSKTVGLYSELAYKLDNTTTVQGTKEGVVNQFMQGLGYADTPPEPVSGKAPATAVSSKRKEGTPRSVAPKTPESMIPPKEKVGAELVPVKPIRFATQTTGGASAEPVTTAPIVAPTTVSSTTRKSGNEILQELLPVTE